jgi:hypothetical protein
MIIVRPTSLASTLDSVSEAFFYQNPIPTSFCEEISSMLVSRQNQFGANAGFFIPFTAEAETQARLFSGEQLHTDFARNHITLIESARALKLLSVDSRSVTQSIQIADTRMHSSCYSKFCPKGECKSLTIAYMRYLAAGDSLQPDPRTNSFLAKLKDYRDGRGKWNGFPFYYTLLMLSEVGDPLAVQELQYAAPLCEKLRIQMETSDTYGKRRQAILSKVLAGS